MADSVPKFPMLIYLAFDTSFVDDLVNVVGRNSGFSRSGGNVKNLTGELSNLSHGLNAFSIEDLELVAVDNGSAVLGVAILGPHGVRNGLGDLSRLGQRVYRPQRAGEVEAGKGVVVTGCWIW